MQNNKRMTVVPLRWKSIAGTAVLLTLTLNIVIAFAEYDPFAVPHFIVYAIFVVLAFRFLRLGVHYAFCRDYLEARLFGIPFWRISWNRIATATYLHAWRDIQWKYSSALHGVVPDVGNTYEQIIYVTLKGCPQYHPQYEIRLLHNLLHPLRTVCIWLPYSSKYHYLDEFKSCYPNLKIQHLDAWKQM